MPELLRKTWKIRFTLGPWFLASVIFVNVYQSIAVSSLLTPFQKTSISLFEHLTTIDCSYELIQKNNLFTTATFYNINETDIFYDNFKNEISKMIPRSINPEKDFYIFSSLTPTKDRNFLMHYPDVTKWGAMQKFWRFILIFACEYAPEKLMNRNLAMSSNTDFKVNRRKRYEDEVLLNMLYPLHTHIPLELSSMVKNLSVSNSSREKPFVDMDDNSEYAIEKAITKCERTAYADMSEDVDREYEYFKKKYPKIQFFKSKETILETNQFWRFPELFVGSKVLYSVKNMFENGIYNMLNRAFFSEITSRKMNKTNSIECKNSSGENGPQAIGLSDKVLSCFIIYVICMCIGVALILIEIYCMSYKLQLSLEVYTIRTFCAKHVGMILLGVKQFQFQPAVET